MVKSRLDIRRSKISSRNKKLKKRTSRKPKRSKKRNIKKQRGGAKYPNSERDIKINDLVLWNPGKDGLAYPDVSGSFIPETDNPSKNEWVSHTMLSSELYPNSYVFPCSGQLSDKFSIIAKVIKNHGDGEWGIHLLNPKQPIDISKLGRPSVIDIYEENGLIVKDKELTFLKFYTEEEGDFYRDIGPVVMPMAATEPQSSMPALMDQATAAVQHPTNGLQNAKELMSLCLENHPQLSDEYFERNEEVAQAERERDLEDMRSEFNDLQDLVKRMRSPVESSAALSPGQHQHALRERSLQEIESQIEAAVDLSSNSPAGNEARGGGGGHG